MPSYSYNNKLQNGILFFHFFQIFATPTLEKLQNTNITTLRLFMLPFFNNFKKCLKKF